MANLADVSVVSQPWSMQPASLGQYDAQPHDCHMPIGWGWSMQPAIPGQHDAQPHGGHMPVGGVQPMFPANFGNVNVVSQPMQPASHAEHDAQPHWCVSQRSVPVHIQYVPDSDMGQFGPIEPDDHSHSRSSGSYSQPVLPFASHAQPDFQEHASFTNSQPNHAHGIQHAFAQSTFNNEPMTHHGQHDDALPSSSFSSANHAQVFEQPPSSFVPQP